MKCMWPNFGLKMVEFGQNLVNLGSNSIEFGLMCQIRQISTFELRHSKFEKLRFEWIRPSLVFFHIENYIPKQYANTFF